jgi:hypothetical protein
LGAVGGFGQPGLACSSCRVMVTITAAGTPPTVGWSSAFSTGRRLRRVHRGAAAHRGVHPDLDEVAVWSSIAVLRGVVSGSTMAFSWAPTVLLSLPCSCHMPSRRWLSSR